jgi:hypothetical protein
MQDNSCSRKRRGSQICVFFMSLKLITPSVLFQDAFFGRDLLDKCKDSQLDEMDLESDDDRDLVGSAAPAAATAVTSSASVLSSSKRFPSASTVDAMETAEFAEAPSEGGGQNQQPSLEWSETKTDLPAASDLDNMGPDATTGDDSDKDHNFGLMIS